MAATMTAPTDEVSRLDMAARAKVAELVVPRLRWIFLFFSIFIGALAIGATSSFYETLCVRAMAALAVIATVLLWSKSRHKLYFPAFFFLSFGIGASLLNWSAHDTFDRIDGLCWGVISFALAIYYLRTKAGIFATVNAPEWDKERAQVDAWWSILTAPESNKKGIIENSTGSFWSGYYTYRLMNPGSYWVVAKLWNCKAGPRSDFRIRHLSDVVCAGNRNGEVMVTIEGRTIIATKISPPMFDGVRAHPLSDHR